MESKNKKEIVFIVYKAGWWGCFDSIYRELSCDSSNICHVIPIPYFEPIREEESVGSANWHYEANQLPNDIPVTDYKKYNLKEHRPDVIYIHNPHNDQNPVYDIDPDYYSSNLKTYTDLLVYIPHMLILDIVPESLKNLTLYQNVDKIIVANDDIKKNFKRDIREKVEVAGSPLVPYVEKLSISRPPIPKEWKSMLSNGNDFDGKRVVLYHLGFAELFYRTERAIKKIQYVFDYMKARKDIVFVWRPDVEIVEKLNDLPNNVSNDYLQLVRRFKAEKIGIYDSTDDACVASVLSDAYIGDHDPIMNLFGMQGKPIVLMDTECRYLPLIDEVCSVSFFDCSIDGDNIWFVANEYNVLCKMNLISGQIEIIAEIPDEDAGYGKIGYCGIVKQKNHVYLNPYTADTFVIYDVEKNTFSKKYLPEPKDVNFDSIIQYNEYLFMKSKYYPAIVKYDTLNNKYEYFSSWVHELEEYVCEEDVNEPYFLWGVVELDEKLMLASSKANVVMEFDMENGEYKFYEVGPKGSKFFGMEYDGENFWLIPYLGNDIICWNYKTGDWEVFHDLTNEIYDKRIPYRSIVKKGESIIVLPCHAKYALSIDVKHKKIEKCETVFPYLENSYKSEFYGKWCTQYNFAKEIKKDLILALAMYDLSILLIDSEYNTIQKLPCRIPVKKVYEYQEKMFENIRSFASYPCSISESYTLSVLTDYFKNSDYLINYYEKSVYYSKIEGNR